MCQEFCCECGDVVCVRLMPAGVGSHARRALCDRGTILPISSAGDRSGRSGDQVAADHGVCACGSCDRL